VLLEQGVEPAQGRGDPVAAHLSEHEPEVRESVEDTTERELPQRTATGEVAEEVVVDARVSRYSGHRSGGMVA
jgi:hypothetical protein